MSTISMINPAYIAEMQNITKTIGSYSGYEKIADSLVKCGVPLPVVAGLIGCIIPESGTNHRILNSKEFYGKGASGTEGWNCGEGLIQWTFWKDKLPLIKKYNKEIESDQYKNDGRVIQKLPTDERTYMQGMPVKSGNLLLSNEDGKHIAGLSLDNQMLFLKIYYSKLINELKDETNLAVITAKIYQQKAGIGFYKNISDPVERAYTTSKNKYKSTSGNHYLQSLKLAMEFMNVGPSSTSVNETYLADAGGTGVRNQSTNDVPNIPNRVYMLAKATRINDPRLKFDERRKSEFESLQMAMAKNTPQMGRDIYLSEEMYDSNILKGSQESKKEPKRSNYNTPDKKTENV